MRVSLYAEIIQTQLDPAAERLHCTGAQNIHIHFGFNGCEVSRCVMLFITVKNFLSVVRN